MSGYIKHHLYQGSLLASMTLGVLLMKREYSTKKYISVFAITIGIIVCTLATGSKVRLLHFFAIMVIYYRKLGKGLFSIRNWGKWLVVTRFLRLPYLL